MEKIEVHCNGIPYGFMVWWKKNDGAARYFVHLFICKTKNVYDNFKREYKAVIEESNEISVVEIDRNIAYHTFTNLAQINYRNDRYGRKEETGLSYFVKTEAESRDGKTIASSDMMKADIG